MTFTALGLTPALADAAREQGYAAPTPIQTAAIPPVLQGRDVRGCAQTGSGKTAAFVLPLLQQALVQRTASATGPRRLRTLILVPTRELAMQVGQSVQALLQALAPGKAAPLKLVMAFGGVSINPQLLKLRGGADWVVATPGRLLDLIDHNALRLDGVQTLVLDEADRLLDLGFADELGRILTLLPRQRQTLFFSATFAPAVQQLAATLLREPVCIDIAPTAQDRLDIQQRAIAVDAARRTQLLRQLLVQQAWPRVLVFVATQYATVHIADKLRRLGLNAEPFHGQLSQGKRDQVLHDFKAGRIQVVVATDLAGRGIDIAQLPAVVNFDLPRSSTDYLHRIGRTGRAGESGHAVSFVQPDAEAHWRLIEKRLDLDVPREVLPGFEPTPVAPRPTAAPNAETIPGTGGIKGKRPSKKDKLRAAAAAAASAGGEA